MALGTKFPDASQSGSNIDGQKRLNKANDSIVIEAGRTNRFYWVDLWKARELLLFLSWRDVAVHYKQTIFGVAWALIRPLSTVFIFVLIFGKIFRYGAAGQDAQVQSMAESRYFLTVLVGILPWQLFAGCFAKISDSLMSNKSLISKIYFPRLVLPISSTAICLVDFLITFVFLILMMALFQVMPTWRIIVIPLLILQVLLAALAVGLWLASLYVRYRDVGHVIPFLTQFGMFLSPVAYETSKIPEKYQFYYGLNPLVSAIDGFRWALIPDAPPVNLESLLFSSLLTFVILYTGIRYFQKTEQTFADVI